MARTQMVAARAEASAIRAQFNPHFVFNTLHSLMLLIRAEPETAERAIEDVAALIRYAASLQRRSRDAVPLKEELAIVRRYLALEKLRLAERLDERWQVADGLDDTGVPPFTIQTLVENAVRHGIADAPAGGVVSVTVGREHDGVRIEVADNGVGARDDHVTAEERGLDLLRRRLELLYGDRASLAWTTAPGQGFTAVVRLPAVAAAPQGDTRP
jgi:LytS/YehU family sensor histidine kinase